MFKHLAPNYSQSRSLPHMRDGQQYTPPHQSPQEAFTKFAPPPYSDDRTENYSRLLDEGLSTTVNASRGNEYVRHWSPMQQI